MFFKKYKAALLTVLVIAAAFVISQFDAHLTSFSAGRADREKNINKLDEALKYIDQLYVDEVDWNETVERAIDGALQSLDPHSVYITPAEAETNEENFQGKYQGIGIQFDVIDDFITVISVIPGSPAEQVGLLTGDKIIKIDGKSAQGMSSSDVPEKLKGARGSKVTITVVRADVDEPFDLTLIRDDIPISTIHTYFMLDDKTGYIWLNRFAQTTAQELEDALKDLEGQGLKQLILDLRGNGGGLLRQAVEVAGKFIDGHKKVVYTRGRLSRFNDDFYSDDFGQTGKRKHPLIVMIDHGSASASEIVAGAIQDYDRGLIVGSVSFGKGLVQNEFVLKDSSRLRLTVSKYYTPSGRLIQRPYKGKNLEDYYQDGDAADSLLARIAANDTVAERPVFQTESGRKVFGGGGINPDVEVKYESYSRSSKMTTQFFQKRVFFETGSAFVNRNSQINKNHFNDFYEHFNVSDNLLQALKKSAAGKAIQFDAADFDRDREFLKNRLKAEIARNIWGVSRYYQVLLQHDNQLEKARQLFSDAQVIFTQKP